MPKSKLTRKQLHQLVWNNTQKDLAEEFGIETSFLSKICKKYGIPTPISGYWSKIRFGKNPTIKPLIEDERWKDTVIDLKPIDKEIESSFKYRMEAKSEKMKSQFPEILVLST
jgi:hypothetical protein